MIDKNRGDSYGIPWDGSGIEPDDPTWANRARILISITKHNLEMIKAKKDEYRRFSIFFAASGRNNFGGRAKLHR